MATSASSLSSEQHDHSSSSDNNDYFGTFQRFLRGEKCAESTSERLNASPPKPSRVTSNGGESNGESPVAVAPSPSVAWVLLRSIIIDLPLATLFALFLISWFFRSVYLTYYIPLLVRSHRPDSMLLDEHTYYERQCTQYDVTTHDMNDMILGADQSVDDAVDVMLRHGMTVLHDILTPSTVQSLREYIVYRNGAIPEFEEYPMSQGYKRMSYGIEPTEHPAVAQAVLEVANHPMFRPLISALLGDEDPGSSEITAITNFPGCSLQGWHQDTKQDGNALKFARTFSHSYSLFISLQNITSLMGGTDVCPGTHYCANDILEMCEHHGLNLDEVNPEYGFPAGAGALLNQHVWHRGGAHSDFSAPERIVFIVSFLARPKFDSDPRQLSRGTYFHQKWSMWGHTINDMLDPVKRMRPPFSFLRAFSVWKPTIANWGYDLIISRIMLIANEQLFFEEFEERFLPKLEEFRFPKFLWGEVVNDGTQLTMWSHFFRETLDKCFAFSGYLALAAHGIFVAVQVLRAYLHRKHPVADTQRRPIYRSAVRLGVTHGLLFLSGFALWFRIRQSQWGLNVQSGRMLQRPFPGIPDMRFLETQTVSNGLTTTPTRWDVLLGTRFDADFLGSYDQWLDYHPGNVIFRQIIDQYAESYVVYKSASRNFRSSAIRWVLREIQAHNGRFLLQDFRTGNWRILNTAESSQAVSDAMLRSRVEPLGRLIRVVDRTIAEKRFGFGRESHMFMYTHLLLFSLRKALLEQDIAPSVVGTTSTLSARRTQGLRVKPFVSAIKPRSATLRLAPLHDRHSALTSPRSSSDDAFPEGSLVWWISEDTMGWLPGIVLGSSVGGGQWVHIASNDFGLVYTVHRNDVKEWKPITEGDRIMGCMQDEFNDCYHGAVHTVLPGGELTVAFDDGDYEDALPPDKYFQYPFVYVGPMPA